MGPLSGADCKTRDASTQLSLRLSRLSSRDAHQHDHQSEERPPRGHVEVGHHSIHSTTSKACAIANADVQLIFFDAESHLDRNASVAWSRLEGYQKEFTLNQV